MNFDVKSSSTETDFMEFGNNNILIELFLGTTDLTIYDSGYSIKGQKTLEMTCNFYEVIVDDKVLCIDIYNKSDSREVYGNVYVYDNRRDTLNFVTDKLYLGELASGCFMCFSFPTFKGV